MHSYTLHLSYPTGLTYYLPPPTWRGVRWGGVGGHPLAQMPEVGSENSRSSGVVNHPTTPRKRAR